MIDRGRSEQFRYTVQKLKEVPYEKSIYKIYTVIIR